MNRLCLSLWLTLGGLALGAQAQTQLPQEYAPYGRLLVVQLDSAPFPHPLRAQGHSYKDKQFPAKEHYADNTVGIFIPKGFRETGTVDLLVHFHGWNNTVAGTFQRYRLVEQLAASGRNAVLVVPEGPHNAPDSFGGKLEDPDGFKRFIHDVQTVLRQQAGFTNQDFALGRILLSGHSGGYKVISSILACGGLSDKVSEVWLFDALYGQTEKFLAWHDQQHGRLLNIYTEHGGTKGETEKLLALLKQRGTPYFAGQDDTAKPADLKAKLVFLYTALGHNEVLDQHRTFQAFLETSGLAAREPVLK